jgi:hypothetical protein|tara:strand:- start:460 stop:639 length:180 start_codon:yes stop_codon:yes gene_type:complete
MQKMSQDVSSLVRQFCMIQLQVLKDKEKKLRKEILDSKMQREFLESMLVKIEEDKNDNS